MEGEGRRSGKKGTERGKEGKDQRSGKREDERDGEDEEFSDLVV